MSRITITGINLDGEQVSETIDVTRYDKPFYSRNRYAVIGPEDELHFRMYWPTLWRRFVLRFFKKWPTINKIEVV